MISLEKSGVQQIWEIRSQTYKLLSLAFSQPNIQSLKAIVKASFESAENSLPVLTPVHFPIEEIQLFVRKAADCMANDALRELRVEYVRLFLGPRKALVSPYESTYLNRDDRVMGEAAVEVLVRYQKDGLELHPGFRDLPDHITAELEYLHYLCAKHANVEMKSCDVVVQNLDWEQEFIEKHLMKWVPSLLTRVASNSYHSYYLTLAEATKEFLQFERGHLSSAITVLSP